MRHRHRPRRAATARALACTVAGGLVLTGCGDQSGDRALADGSTSSSSASEVAIPDDFPLSAGMGGSRDVIATSRTGTGLRDLELCRTTPLRGLGTRDRMVADTTGGESAATRELVLLSGTEEATALGEVIAALAADCDEAEETGGRDRMETRTEVLGSPFGPTPATTLQQTYTVDGTPGTGATVVHLVPVGPPRDTVDALEVFGDVPAPVDEPAEESSASRISRVGSARLLVRTYAEGSLASLDGQADEVTATSENILPAMCVSTKTGC